AVQSELLANESLPHIVGDPRAAAALEKPLEVEHFNATDNAVVLVHKTRRSGLRIGAAMDHYIEGPTGVLTEGKAFEDGGLVSAATPLKPGETLRIIKLVAYGWSAERSLPAVRDQVWAALSSARQTTWDGLQDDQRAFLADFWSRADVEVDGDAFWDTETFVLPLLNVTVPDAAASALRWRHSTLPMARERAAQLGLAGA